MVFADKTTNMYEMSKDEYTKLINDNVKRPTKKRQHLLKQKSTKEQNTLQKS